MSFTETQPVSQEPKVDIRRAKAFVDMLSELHIVSVEAIKREGNRITLECHAQDTTHAMKFIEALEGCGFCPVLGIHPTTKQFIDGRFVFITEVFSEEEIKELSHRVKTIHESLLTMDAH